MSTVKANAILDASGGNTATFNGIPLRQGVLDPQNLIINGAMDFWQRGTSFTTAVYGADRWFNGLTGGTVTQSQQAFTLGTTIGSSNPTYFLRQDVTGQTLTTQYANTQQRIEGVRSYAGQTITILGWAKRGTGSGNMALEAEQNFGTGGSPSAGVTAISPTTVTLTTSWAAFAVTMTIPSITGKTLGSNLNDFLAINFWTSAGSTFNARTNSLGLQTIAVDLWGVHIKLGTQTTAAVDLYKQPELGPELARCKRYYEQYGPNYRVSIGTSANSSTTTTLATLIFSVSKRATPIISYGGGWRTLGANQGGAISALAFSEPSLTNVTVQATGTSYVQGMANYIQSTDGFTGFITVDAEL